MSLNQFKSRRTTKRYFYSPAMIVVFVVAIGFLARATWSIHGKYELSKSKLGQAEGQLAALTAQKSDLSQSIAELSTASGTESVMRTDFRIVKPGESLAVIIDTATTATATVTPPLSFWQGIGAWFSGFF